LKTFKPISKLSVGHGGGIVLSGLGFYSYDQGFFSLCKW